LRLVPAAGAGRPLLNSPTDFGPLFFDLTLPRLPKGALTWINPLVRLCRQNSTRRGRLQKPSGQHATDEDQWATRPKHWLGVREMNTAKRASKPLNGLLASANEMSRTGAIDQPREDKRPCEIVLELVDHLDAMVAYWDINETCVFANNAYRDWFGRSREEVVGRTLQQLLGPLYAKNLPYLAAEAPVEGLDLGVSVGLPGREKSSSTPFS